MDIPATFRPARLLAAALLCFPLGGQALAWGQEGHSIVAEIAQRRLSPDTAATVARLLGSGTSLASVASWADDVRSSRPETGNWHFVDIPLASDVYDPGRDCRNVRGKGDCVVAELARLDHDLRCAPDGPQRAEALKLAVHFVGDVHQPLHTVGEERGGNDIAVDVFVGGLICTGSCSPRHTPGNLHALWDSTLIQRTVYDWGAYVDRLEAGWLKTADASAVARGTPVDWALEAHGEARRVWRDAGPAPVLIDDDYYRQAMPVLDRALGEAGIRLAAMLDAAFAPGACLGR